MITEKQLTRDEAKAFFGAKKWEGMTKHEIAVFQLEQELLCMPWSTFHRAVEEALGRPVYEIEMAYNRDQILDEIKARGLAGKEQ